MDASTTCDKFGSNPSYIHAACLSNLSYINTLSLSNLNGDSIHLCWKLPTEATAHIDAVGEACRVCQGASAKRQACSAGRRAP